MITALYMLQANVMVEYSYEEALALLENNISVANDRLVREVYSFSTIVLILLEATDVMRLSIDADRRGPGVPARLDHHDGGEHRAHI